MADNEGTTIDLYKYNIMGLDFGFSHKSNLVTLMIHYFKLVKATILEFSTLTARKSASFMDRFFTVVYQVHRIGCVWKTPRNPSQLLPIYDTVSKLLASYILN